MSTNTLKTLLRVRQCTLDEAQQAVSEAHQVEQLAMERADSAGATPTREMQTAMDLAGGDDAVERFARWLPTGRRALKSAQDGHCDATAALDRARAVLALARSGVRAVELLIEQETDRQTKEATRKEQVLLDDMGRARR